MAGMKTIVVTPLYPLGNKPNGIRYVISKILELNQDQKCITICHPGDIEEPIEEPIAIEKVDLTPQKNWKLLLKWACSFYPMAIIRMYPAIKKIRKRLQQLDFDQLNLCYPFLLPLMKGYPKERLLFTSIDSFSLVILRRLKLEKNLFKKLYLSIDFLKYYVLERKYYKKARKVLFASEVDIAHLNKWNIKGHFERLYLGIDPIFFKSYKKPTTKKLVFVGDYAYFTNEEAALFLIEQVMPLLKKEEIILYLVGIHPTKKMIEAQSEHVIVTGRVDSLSPYFEQCAVFVAPLMNGAGIKIKVLQAMAMQNIVIGSNVALDGIEGIDSVHFIRMQDFDPKKWAQAILEVLEKRPKLGKAARELMQKKHSWNAFFKHYEKEYEAVANK
jgi:glycosyltransferase involved in cell wall biosynthesis